MTDKPDLDATPHVFFIHMKDDEGRLGIAWQPDPEAGGATVIKWLPDEMLEEAYRCLLNRRMT